MNINLYYIEGLSREDTLYLIDDDSVTSSFFANHLVASIDGAYYPPYYENIINLEIDSKISLGLRFNYLSFVYNNKVYYYFINSIHRLSDGILALSITMDTIITFYKDIHVIGGYVERKFINRYTEEGKLNRNYIRENFGNNDFHLAEYKYLDTYMSYLMVDMTSEGNANNLNDTAIVNYHDTEPDVDNPQSNTDYSIYFGNLTSIYVIPFSLKYAKEDLYLRDANNPNKPDISYNFYHSFNRWSISPSSNAIFIVPLIGDNSITPIKKTSASGNPISFYSDTFKVGDGYTIISEDADDSYLKVNSLTIRQEPNYSFETISTYDACRSKPVYATNRLFDSSLVPALVDDNYQHVYFGEKANLATYPLYESTSNTLYFRGISSIFDGTRIYGISEDTTDSRFVKGSYVICSKAEMLTTWSDTYTSWQANNRATIIGGAASFLTNYFTGAFKLGVNATAIQNQAMYDMKYEGRVGSNATKGDRMQKVLDDASVQQYSNTQQYKVNGSGGISSLIGIATAQENAFFAPDAIKSMGTFFTDYLSGACRIMYYVTKVSNFEQCASIYHRIGYLVNQPINDSHTINSLIDSRRYYYQFLKLSGIFIRIDDYINSAELVGDIKTRLENGLRLWSIRDNDCKIGYYLYDNQEVS